VYQITVTGVSGSISETTTVCVAVGTSSSSCTPASNSGNFYILNSGISTSSIAGFSISSGKLTSISGSSYTVSGASAVAIAPSGYNFLYVASQGGGITLYTITNTGALTPGASIDGDTAAQAIQVDPSGKWLLDASALGTLRAIPITSSGTVDSSRLVQSQPLAGTPVQIAITPNGALVAVALGSTGFQIFSFSSGSASPLGSGSTAVKPTNASAGSTISVAMDPQNRLLYVGEVAAFPSSTTNSGALRVFTIGGSTVTEFTYSKPYASGGLAPNFILPAASGAYVYVANGSGVSAAGNITGFAVTTTALTTGSTVTTGAQPLGMAEDSTGSFIFEVGSSGSPYFNAYTFDPTTTGQLDSQVTSTSAATSIAIVAAP
jgi:6-phosphogluconolactonase (cycloisomerase 2 family)